MKFKCSKCGTIFEEGAVYCPGCGSKIAIKKPEATTPVEAAPVEEHNYSEEPVADPIMDKADIVASPETKTQTFVQNPAPVMEQKKGKKGLGVAFSIISLIVDLPMFLMELVCVAGIAAVLLIYLNVITEQTISFVPAEYVSYFAASVYTIGFGGIGFLVPVIVTMIFTGVAKKKTDAPRGLVGFARVIAVLSLIFFIIQTVVFGVFFAFTVKELIANFSEQFGSILGSLN